MICWVNGSFGAGKTTLTEELKARYPGALVFDPEEVGFMLRGMLAPAASGDFQDLPAWRLLVVETGRVLAQQHGGLVIVPMTVADPGYAREIFGGLAAYKVPVRHFFLEVPAARLRERIIAQVIHPGDPQRDAEVRRWRLAQVARCAAAADAFPDDTIILDGELPPARLAGEVLEVLSRDAGFAASGGGAPASAG